MPLPWVGALAAVLAALTVLAAVGLSRVWFSDDYREIFRSERDDFRLMEEVSRQFGDEGLDLAVLLRSDDLLAASVVAELDRLTTDLGAIAGVASVDSPTTVSRLLQTAAGVTERETRSALREAIREHPLLGGQLISDDVRAALVVVRLDARLDGVEQLRPVLDGIDARLGTVAAGLQVSRTGLPYLRTEIVQGVQSDQKVFTVVGLVLGGLIAWVALRGARPALLAGAGPLVGVVWTLGAMGWLDEPLNVINNVVPVLVLVIGMTDSVHFVRELQSCRAAGATQPSAALEALRRVLLPCSLTSLTTALGFASLTLADVSMVRRFGATCAAGMVVSFIAVLTVGPLLAGWTALGRCSRPAGAPFSRTLREWLAALEPRSRILTAAGWLVVVLGVAAFAHLGTEYQYREFLPADSPSRVGLDRMEAVFGGSHPLRVVVQWPRRAADGEVLEVLEEVERAVAASPVAAAPLSLLAPLRAVAGASAAGDLPAPAVVPAGVRDRLWSSESRRALIEARLRGVGASRLEPGLQALEVALSELETRHSGFSVRLSGLAPVSARASLRMLDSLSRSLAGALLGITATLCVVLRSVRLGLVSVLPNLLPLGAICLFLVVSGRPLQFTTVTVLSVVLGLAVDDSIHFLTGFQRERRSGVGVEAALAATLDRVGGTLVVTTALLVAGFAAVGLSRAPLMSLFGWLAAGALVTALVADLVFLPAMLRVVYGPTGGDRPWSG